MGQRTFRVGSRGSALALAQSGMVLKACQDQAPDAVFSLETIVTQGDRKQGTAAAAFGDKKDWIREIEEALQRGTIDFAVHSAKDVPLTIEPDTELCPVLVREVPYDVLVLREPPPTDRIDEGLSWIPRRAKIGTSSRRRTAQLLRARPDLRVEPIRGNVPTRVSALERDSELAAVVLAGAGLARLSHPAPHVSAMPESVFIPAVHQGILVAQFLRGRRDIADLLSLICPPTLRPIWLAERGCLAVIDADCSSAVGIFATSTADGFLCLNAEVLSTDGTQRVAGSEQGSTHEAEALGRRLGETLLSAGAEQLLRP